MNEELVIEEFTINYWDNEEPVIFDTVNYLPYDAKEIFYNSLEKYPYRAEQITIDYCNMMLRNYKFTAYDVERTFKEVGITKKYYIDSNGLHIIK